MSETPELKSKKLYQQIARLAWVAGLVAIGVIALTGRMPSKAIGEIVALVFIIIGVLSAIVALAAIPKCGTKDIIAPALVGIAINGLLLSIFIPNFLHARAQRNTVEQSVQSRNNWRQYKIAGLDLSSPVELTNFNSNASFQRAQKRMQLSPEEKAAAEDNLKRLESYSGQIGRLLVTMNRRTLLPDQETDLEALSDQVSQLMHRQFPQGFHSGVRDVTLAGIPAKRVSLQFQTEGKLAKVECLIILKRPNLWQIQMFGPADFPNYGESAEKIFNSIKFLEPDSK